MAYPSAHLMATQRLSAHSICMQFDKAEVTNITTLRRQPGAKTSRTGHREV